MRLFWSLFESLLLEAAALTKGSQRVMNDKKTVAALAEAIRDDAMSNPSVFPGGFRQKAQKAPDEELAHWFLESLDKIERAGYEGTVYSRDGVNSEWIAKRYIAGSHNWEDIIGVMNMNLRDWYALKQRNMLDAGHQDLFKFKSVRDVGKYMSTHYHDRLADVRNAAKLAGVKKQAKSALIVDNDDYKIYTVFNWAAARVIGNGTQWCTANSENDTNYGNYSRRAMLFQLFPKNPEEVERQAHALTGVARIIKGPEKYQFDAGTPCFHDIADHPASAEDIKKKFPYIYTDLVKGLKDNKEKLETALKELGEDPALQDKVSKVHVYKIDDEIKKLKAIFELGYFTTKVRPAPKPEQQAAEQPALPTVEPEQKPQGGQVMEGVDKDVEAMLKNLKKLDMLTESMAPVLEKKGGKKPEWLYNKEVDAEKKEDKKVEEAKECSVCHHSPCECDDKKVEEGVDPEVLSWMKRFDKLGVMKNWE